MMGEEIVSILETQRKKTSTIFIEFTIDLFAIVKSNTLKDKLSKFNISISVPDMKHNNRVRIYFNNKYKDIVYSTIKSNISQKDMNKFIKRNILIK